jgi:hypothetical protein
MSALNKWFQSRPAATIERLKKINLAATSSSHIILALSYGVTDPYIRATNKMIVSLLLGRHKAQKRGDSACEARFEAKLQDIHDAINLVTGMAEKTKDGGHVAGQPAGNACKRPAMRPARQH